MLIRERIIQYLFLKGISRYRFYKETGLSNGFLDKEGAINSDNCEKICSCYKDLNPEWLLMGTGEMLRYAEGVALVNSYTRKNKTNNVTSVEVLVNKIVELSSENSLLKNENATLRRLSGKTNVVEHKPLTEDDVQENIAATPAE
ncbi:MAG: hypothetical protein VB102_04055 [Paludibacter sp.]|nr:hypothetical protein [Paludibacter sp.]